MTGKKLKIFVVDDDPDMLAFMVALLEASGHEVKSTVDAASSPKAIVAFQPDCVLLDLMMPALDGMEICQRLRKEKKLASTRIVIVSAKSYEFDRRRALQMGADGYIVKPLGAETFAGQVEEIVADRMTLSFWGVRGTLPVPGANSLKYGGNTNCVSLEFPKGNFFIFDAGTGIKVLSDRLFAQKRLPLDAKIFISHPHWDHINALPFFGPLYTQGSEFEILGASHGNISMRELMAAQMEGIYFPITLKEFASRVYFHNLGEEELLIDRIRVRSKLLSHPGKCLGYRVEYGDRSICYITDNELYLESSPSYNAFYVRRLKEFVAGTDALVTDTTYSDAEYLRKEGWGHSAIGPVVDLAHDAGVKTLYLFHHDPDQTDADIDAKLAQAKALLEQRGSKTQCIAPAEGQAFKI